MLDLHMLLLGKLGDLMKDLKARQTVKGRLGWKLIGGERTEASWPCKIFSDRRSHHSLCGSIRCWWLQCGDSLGKEKSHGINIY